MGVGGVLNWGQIGAIRNQVRWLLGNTNVMEAFNTSVIWIICIFPDPNCVPKEEAPLHPATLRYDHHFLTRFPHLLLLLLPLSLFSSPALSGILLKAELYHRSRQIALDILSQLKQSAPHRGVLPQDCKLLFNQMFGLFTQSPPKISIADRTLSLPPAGGFRSHAASNLIHIFALLFGSEDHLW